MQQKNWIIDSSVVVFRFCFYGWACQEDELELGKDGDKERFITFTKRRVIVDTLFSTRLATVLHYSLS